MSSRTDKNIRKAGLIALREEYDPLDETKGHPQQWRVERVEGPRKKIIGAGGRLGPMGELGQTVLFSVHVTDYGRRLLERRIRDFSKNKVWRSLTQMVYNPLQTRLEQKVDKWVPKDTGRLRGSLKASITPAGGSTVEIVDMMSGRGFTVLLATPGIKYAKVVNRMPTKWLQHPGPRHGAGETGRTGRTLNDPDAKTGWYNLLVLDSRSFIRNRISVWRKMMIARLGGGSRGYAEFRKSFSIAMK